MENTIPEKRTGRTIWDLIYERTLPIIIIFSLLFLLLSYTICVGIPIKIGNTIIIGEDETTEYSPDPIGIAGKWKYVVTPVSGERLLGIDPDKDTLREMYDRYEGTFTIEPIQPGSTCYSMPPGKRACAYIGDNPVPNTEKNLYFSQIYYSKHANRDAYSFKFDVSIIPNPNTNTNQGFVEVPVLTKDSNNRITHMTGKIYYLYQNGDSKNRLRTQIWQLVNIEFSRNN